MDLAFHVKYPRKGSNRGGWGIVGAEGLEPPSSNYGTRFRRPDRYAPMRFSEALKSRQLPQLRLLDSVALHCDGCGAPFTRTQKQFRAAIYRSRQQMFCSKRCQSTAQVTTITVPCAQCGRGVSRSFSQRARSRHSFCSQSCSASFHNQRVPKRKKILKVCSVPLCEELVASSRKYCVMCKPKRVTRKTLGEWLRKWGTLGDVQRRASYQVNSQVRAIARKVYEVLDLPMSCLICGYDKHIDVCHARGIEAFPLTTAIAIINDPFNLLGLCKNHHWEFDHDLLSDEDRDYLIRVLL